MSEYDPLRHSIVQATTGTWCKYDCDDFIEALFMAILEEVKRVHWNVYQHQWAPSWHGDAIEDPEIPGILFTRYYDGCACEDEEEHSPDCRHAKPNFQHEDVQFRWYKYPGRGMSTNKEWSSDEWRAWFQRCLATVRAFEGDHMSDADSERHDSLRSSLQARFPEVFHGEPDQEARKMMHWMEAFVEMENAQTPCWKCSEAGMFGQHGGGHFESGPHGCVARTLHEDDDPDGACRNCGHTNTEEEKMALEERRRLNSDDERARFADESSSPETTDPQ